MNNTTTQSEKKKERRRFQPSLMKVVLTVLPFVGAFALWQTYANRATEPSEELLAEFSRKFKEFGPALERKDRAILIDYAQPVYKKRLWVVRLDSMKVEVNAHVGHAFASGWLKPSDRSNEEGTLKTCAGLFATGESYKSEHGDGEHALGLRLDGLEPEVNGNARARQIVFHSAYFPVWSEGCFVTSPEVNERIVELAAGGAAVFVRAPE